MSSRGQDGAGNRDEMASNPAQEAQNRSTQPSQIIQQDLLGSGHVFRYDNTSTESQPSTRASASSRSSASAATSSVVPHELPSQRSDRSDEESSTDRGGQGQDRLQVTVPDCMCQWDGKAYGILESASTTPPVTPDTLKELELPYIQNNINLRVDLNYDEDLHFTPVSGQRGLEKRSEAARYLCALEWEFKWYLSPATENCQQCHQPPPRSFSFPQRLPKMFEVLQALLLLLVPRQDHAQVLQALDLELLMQQIRNKCLDVLTLAKWLSNLLTSHCAPIRDALAFDMRDKIARGASTGDMAALVAGLGQLFSFCEAMKLDVANHQIRTFRYPLIADGVSFQRDYFQTRISMGRLDPRPSQDWITWELQRRTPDFFSSSEYGGVVFILCLLVIRPDEMIVDFFRHDSSRINQLREEVSDLIHLEACRDFVSGCSNRTPSMVGHRNFYSRLLDLTDGESTPGMDLDGVWEGRLDALSTELAREIFAISTSPLGISFSDTVAGIKDRLFLEKDVAERTERFQLTLQNRVLHYASQFGKLSALRIYELQQNYRQTHQFQGRHIPELEDVARRIAHIAVIHWRVWYDRYNLPVPSQRPNNCSYLTADTADFLTYGSRNSAVICS
jgi:hypothetical protein